MYDQRRKKFINYCRVEIYFLLRFTNVQWNLKYDDKYRMQIEM